MKSKRLPALLLITVFFLSCSKSVNYSEAFKTETSGRYLYNPDEIIEIYYKENTLYIKWLGAEQMKPVVLSETEFFIPDMYKKLRFTVHPKTQKRYLSIMPEDASKSEMSYDYIKLADDDKTPSEFLNDKAYDKALTALLKIQKDDSLSTFIRERRFNRLGYKNIRDQNYSDAIEVFKINVALHPDSDNVYDSLADAYVINGDSINAFKNYTKALELNTGNKRAKNYISSYKKSHPNLDLEN